MAVWFAQQRRLNIFFQFSAGHGIARLISTKSLNFEFDTHEVTGQFTLRTKYTKNKGKLTIQNVTFIFFFKCTIRIEIGLIRDMKVKVCVVS